jgi:hypothetical protein
MRRTAMLMLLLLAVLALPLASVASADTAVHVSGTDVGPDAGTTVCQPVNSSGFLLTCTTPDFATSYTGDLTGAISANFIWTINCNSSLIEGHAVETFTGSVAGIGSGTLTWQTQFHANFDCRTLALSSLYGTGTIQSGTGELAGLYGTLIFSDSTYFGTLSQ